MQRHQGFSGGQQHWWGCRLKSALAQGTIVSHQGGLHNLCSGSMHEQAIQVCWGRVRMRTCRWLAQSLPEGLAEPMFDPTMDGWSYYPLRSGAGHKSRPVVHRRRWCDSALHEVTTPVVLPDDASSWDPSLVEADVADAAPWGRWPDWVGFHDSSRLSSPKLANNHPSRDASSCATAEPGRNFRTHSDAALWLRVPTPQWWRSNLRTPPAQVLLEVAL